MTDKLKKLDYKNSVAFISRNASKTLEKALDTELLSIYGLSSSQWKIVAALAIRSGISQKELADFLSLDALLLFLLLTRWNKINFL